MSNQHTGTGESMTADEGENYTANVPAAAAAGTAVDPGHHSYQQLEPCYSYVEPQPQDVTP